MKIVDTDVIVTSPGRNHVTLELVTDEGVVGYGDALPHRHLEQVMLLLGRVARRGAHRSRRRCGAC